MASAALAYKCVEVAYLRVMNSSHSSVSKDRHELQTALQLVPPGKIFNEYKCHYCYALIGKKEEDPYIYVFIHSQESISVHHKI